MVVLDTNIIIDHLRLQTAAQESKLMKLAGEIARDLDRPIELADAAIAATAILSGGPLSTSNTKDFVGIDRLQLV